ncbi:hypothetical protein Pan153_23500 [Gimesia panareensis]|uniref:Uncharacterized protein n=1 Tax=Gimesia panareensis TaxID=2527978 RepID=A0A518FMW3_9PLAN|nr:hypothetical protein [Gimesia panareensis]QDV17696.1 hypothetical protein Pan153_23500 [Gimesia panareensis]
MPDSKRINQQSQYILSMTISLTGEDKEASRLATINPKHNLETATHKSLTIYTSRLFRVFRALRGSKPRSMRMDGAVDFSNSAAVSKQPAMKSHYEINFCFHEIRDILPDRLLPSEMNIHQPSIMIPPTT